MAYGLLNKNTFSFDIIDSSLKKNSDTLIKTAKGLYPDRVLVSESKTTE